MGKRGPKPKIDPQIFVTEYLNGKDTSELSEIYNLDSSVIRRHIINKGIKLRPRGTVINKCVKLNYFSQKNASKKSLYWIGFIAGDGNVSNNRLSIYQSHNYGKFHLNKFRQDLSITNDVKCRKENSYTISIFGKEIIEDLNSYGIIQNKSVLGGNLNIPEQFHNSFALGLLDADGWIGFSAGRYSIGYCGHIDYLTFIKNCFQIHLDINLKIHKRKNCNNWTMLTSRRTYIQKISTWLLNGCEYSLQRKREKLINIAQGV